MLLERARSFDAAGKVSSASTNLNGATDNQAFCYHAPDRLIWAGSSGTLPAARPSPRYAGRGRLQPELRLDNLGRLAMGPLGAYSYGDPAYLHAGTSMVVIPEGPETISSMSST